MAFIDIKDPLKREETVKDYIKTVKEIQARRENEKVRGISQRQDLAKVFQPVVQATEKSASAITNELKNLKKETEEEEENGHQKPKLADTAIEYYLNQFNKSKLDQYFGIYKENDGVYKMGNKEVVVDGQNNIFLNNGAVSFKGTHGLWRLIMCKVPEQFAEKDFENYKELLNMTNAIEWPHKISLADRPRSTAKWRFFTQNGLREVDEDEEEEEEEEEESESDEEEKHGTGIQYLPGDITGLLEQLHLLLAESRAGNKSSTRNQIVAILDELLRRNYLNQEEYNAVSEEIC